MKKSIAKLTGTCIPLVWIVIFFLTACTSEQITDNTSEILKVDFENLISRADIILDKPVPRKEAGLPVGNGRMGSLVWTSPTAMKFQVNRTDVYANNSYSNSFPVRHSDYGFGTGFVDIDFASSGLDVFPAENTSQHLSVYDGLLSLEGTGVKARVLAWNFADIMAIEITDSREQTLPVSTKLRMLRPPQVATRSHLAVSKLEELDGRIVLTQEFTEDDYYCSSALAVAVSGRETQIRLANDQELQIIAAPGTGTFTILMASAASFDPGNDVTASALNQLDAAEEEGFKSLLSGNKEWWHRFWSQSFVHLQSPDGEAEFVEKNYTYYLYVMASSSRGKYPPRFGGMLWNTGGDYRMWGVQHWWHNTSCYFRTLLDANRFDLMDPVFDMYSNMYESCANAASEIWGSEGIWIPETVWFDGVEDLPDDIGEEIQELYLVNKPWELRSQKFSEYAALKHPHNSVWNWKGGGKWVNGEFRYESKYNSPFGSVGHIFSTTAKIAWLYWLRYEYSMDETWLRDRAYPMLRGTAEFYRNFPNTRKGADGKYHMYHVNNHEPTVDVVDPMEEIAGMHGILPLAIRASEILGIDKDMRPVWQGFLDSLPPIPTNDDPNSLFPRQEGQAKMFTSGSKPGVRIRNNHRFMPVVYWDLYSLENPDREMLDVAYATFDVRYSDGVNARTPVPVLTRNASTAALLGRAKDVKYMVPNQIKVLKPENDFVGYRRTGVGVMENRMTLREGVQAIGVQRLGRAGMALQYALLQSVPAGPGKEPVIRVFPAWPKEWDAEYTLAARGGFLVTSSIQNEEIGFVELKSNVGGECRLRNPWGEATVNLYRNGMLKEEMNGSLLRFGTKTGENIIVVPDGISPDQLNRTVAGDS